MKKILENSNDEVSAVSELLEESYITINRIKQHKAFIDSDVYRQNKIFVMNPNSEKSKLYTKNFYREYYDHSEKKDKEEYTSYIIRGNAPKYIYVKTEKISIIEGCDILYFVTNSYYNNNPVHYINPDCINLFSIFNTTNIKFQDALKAMNGTPYVRDNMKLLPDWAQNFSIID